MLSPWRKPASFESSTLAYSNPPARARSSLNSPTILGVLKDMKYARWIPAVAALSLFGYAFAQTQTSSSTSTTNSSSSQASSSASTNSKASAGGSFGGSFSGQQSGSGKGSGSSNSGGVKITKPTHVIVYSPNPTGNGGGSREIWEDQTVYWKRQEERGKLLYAGPWRDGPGAMMVLNCANDAEAQDIADQDPVVKANLYIAQVRGWNVTMIGRGVIQMERENK